MVGATRREVHAGQHAVGHVGEAELLGVDEKELLLEPHREGPPAPERVGAATDPGQGDTPSAARAAILPNTSAAARPLA